MYRSSDINWLFIGIDPGSKGGIAGVSSRGEVIYSSFTNHTLVHLWEDISGFVENSDYTCLVCMEQVGGYMKRNEEKGSGGEQPGSAMFNFGVTAGAAEMALVACGMRENENYFKVHPARWQSTLGTPKKQKGGKKNDHKNTLKAFAQDLFPQIKVTQAIADALLLAVYCKRVYGRQIAQLF